LVVGRCPPQSRVEVQRNARVTAIEEGRVLLVFAGTAADRSNDAVFVMAGGKRPTSCSNPPVWTVGFPASGQLRLVIEDPVAPTPATAVGAGLFCGVNKASSQHGTDLATSVFLRCHI
jgi:hypothetical protein